MGLEHIDARRENFISRKRVRIESVVELASALFPMFGEGVTRVKFRVAA